LNPFNHFDLVSSIDPLAACGYSSYVLWALDSARQRTYVQAMTGAGQDVASVGIVWAMLLYCHGHSAALCTGIGKLVGPRHPSRSLLGDARGGLWGALRSTLDACS
jgi:hypothetical protein